MKALRGRQAILHFALGADLVGELDEKGVQLRGQLRQGQAQALRQLLACLEHQADGLG
ncbi:hypothetical protein D3C78_1549980 [compost metagenome]